ncbi:GIY-YIG nuclease family protein [Thermococcus sp.]
MRGSYFLVIKVERDMIVQTKRKEFSLKAGYYVYVGSAMNSIEKRVERHFKKDKKLHWHIDFLLKESELLRAYLIPSDAKIEEELSMEVSKFGKPIEGFGASDLKINSNLYYFKDEPDEILTSILRKLGLKWKSVKSPQ